MLQVLLDVEPHVLQIPLDPFCDAFGLQQCVGQTGVWNTDLPPKNEGFIPIGWADL